MSSTDDEPAPLSRVPFAGMLVAIAALGEQLWNRLLVRVVSDREVSGLTHDLVVASAQFGELLRNTCALLGVLALTFAILEMIHPRVAAPLHQRLGLAGFAGIFVPTILLATVLPAERTTALVVLFALGAVNLLAILLSTSAGRRGAPMELRGAMVTATLASFFSFGATIVLLVGAITLWQHAHPIGTALHHAGEVSWWLALAALGVVAWPMERSRRVQVGLALVPLGLVLLAAYGGQWLAHTLEDEAFAGLSYGLLHGRLLLASMPTIYLVLHALALGVGVAGLVADDDGRRQAACAMLLLLASGVAPTTPLTLLTLALTLVMVWRVLVAQTLRAWLARARQDDLLALDHELDQAEG